jgi:hypothetical protein
MFNSGTILIKNTTKRRLKRIGHKDQTYDELINELLDLKNGRGHSFDEGVKDQT